MVKHHQRLLSQLGKRCGCPLGLSQKGQPYGGPRRSSLAPLLDSFVQVLDCHWTLEWGILAALAAAAAAVSAMVL